MAIYGGDGCMGGKRSVYDNVTWTVWGYGVDFKDLFDEGVEGENSTCITVIIEDDCDVLVIPAELFEDLEEGIFFCNEPGRSCDFSNGIIIV